MRKVLVLALVVMLSTTLLMVVGCGGGDTETAKEYMTSADAMWEDLNKKLTEIDTQSTALITAAITGDLASITAEDLAAVSESLEGIEAEINKVGAEYEKINTLEGVDDYKAYAVARQQALDGHLSAIKAGASLLEALAPIMQTGDQAALAAAIEENMGEIEKIQELSDTADKLDGEADGIKLDYEL